LACSSTSSSDTEVARCKRQLSGALQDARYSRTGYLNVINAEEGESAPELLAPIEALIEQAEAVSKGLAVVDSDLDGALSKPSTRASPRGSQT
jgi:hypothetical protein